LKRWRQNSVVPWWTKHPGKMMFKLGRERRGVYH
jgi:hypothetical protein